VKLTGAAAYKIASDGCTGITLQGQGQCPFSVAFTPTGPCLANALLEVTSSLGLVAQASAVGTGRDFVTVTVLFAGAGAGSVSGPGLSCASGAACAVSVGRIDPLATLTLSATPAPGSLFGGWSQGGCAGTDTCTISLASPPTVTAAFTPALYQLKVNRSGTGAGTVSSNPAGISCGTTCAASYEHGQTVTLTAEAATGSTFDGWSGGGCSGTAPCTVAVTGATAVTAAFTLNRYGLKVITSGTGIGVVSSSPAGIKCGDLCSAEFPYGTGVGLTAAPAPGSSFAGWSLRECGSALECKVPIEGATSITATFKALLTCGLVSNAAACSNGAMPNLMFTKLTPQECQIKCRDALLAAGVTSGCWIMAGAFSDTCYCRDGALSLGGTSYGGSCGP
jgi:hypothetical protein